MVGEQGNLGEGSFAIVKLGFHEAIGAVAVKCIPNKLSRKHSAKKKLINKYVDW